MKVGKQGPRQEGIRSLASKAAEWGETQLRLRGPEMRERRALSLPGMTQVRDQAEAGADQSRH